MEGCLALVRPWDPPAGTRQEECSRGDQRKWEDPSQMKITPWRAHDLAETSANQLQVTAPTRNAAWKSSPVPSNIQRTGVSLNLTLSQDKCPQPASSHSTGNFPKRVPVLPYWVRRNPAVARSILQAARQGPARGPLKL